MTDDAETSLHVYMTEPLDIEVGGGNGGIDLQFYGKTNKVRTTISITKEQAKSLVINLVKVIEIGDE